MKTFHHLASTRKLFLALNDTIEEHADGILQRLHNGPMLCEGAWPHERVETFQRWVESGMQE